VSALADLEQRVVEKWVKAAADRGPIWPAAEAMDCGSWLTDTDTAPLPAYVPQFPREQWLVYPARRTLALIMCEQTLDSGQELSDSEWSLLCLTMWYGGKTRIA
jgi:hypothetical protein